MEENIPDTLLKLSDVMHWLGKYREANALVLLSRWLRARNIETLEVLEGAVLAAEKDAK